MKIIFVNGEKVISEMSPSDQRNLYRDALDAVKLFYKNPENRAAYEKWKAQRNINSR